MQLKESENREKLQRAFSEALGVERERITDEFAYGEKRWDSLGHMALIAKLESEFNVMIDTEDVIAMSSVHVAKQILGKYGVSFAA